MHSLNGEDNLKLTQRHQWKENRLKPGQSFVGLAVSEGCAHFILILDIIIISQGNMPFQQRSIFLHIEWGTAVHERGRAATQPGRASDTVVLLASVSG